MLISWYGLCTTVYPTFHAHNLFLDTLLNFGVVGGCAIFFYVLTQLKMLMKRFQTNVCAKTEIFWYWLCFQPF